MTLSLEKTINAKLAAVFNELNLNPQFAAVKVSDRPDLSDFQCNGALALAKSRKEKSPRDCFGNCRQTGTGCRFCQSVGGRTGILKLKD